MRTSSQSGMWGSTYHSPQDGQQGNECDTSPGKGWLAAVGIGPGGYTSLSVEAREVLVQADAVVGYKTYLELLGDLVQGKQVYTSGMKQEVDRCQKALDLAQEGLGVAIVSSGDPGVYGMAGVVLELNEDPEFPIQVIPGITSANGSAASLGAPLMHDFAVISLSDLLTPWEQIAKRLHAAAEGDFVIVLYNPKSKQRREHIEKARAIILTHRSGNTPVGIVTDNYRVGESVTVSTLQDFSSETIDMSTTVIVGNSQSYTKFGRMITPRGYRF